MAADRGIIAAKDSDSCSLVGRSAGIDFDVPEAATINGFYMRGIGGSNGIIPLKIATV